MTETTERPPTPVMTRLDMMTRGAAVVMTVLLSTGLIVAIGKGDNPTALNVGLHLITMGIVMVLAVGAPANHRAILEGQQDIGGRLDAIEKQLNEVSGYMGRLMNADRDEVADQRGHQH